MVSRKNRIRVVLDTNVLVRSLKSRHSRSPNKQILRLWLFERRLQLIVSKELVEEYLGVFSDILGLDGKLTDQWRLRFLADSRSTLTGLGRRFSESRDPDDNLVLATAHAGQAAYLVTNDRDLLDLPHDFQHTLRFRIVTPAVFLREWEA
jgi:putative PIN family toxin of toxin-antitoxin system